jgi:preprotein translocase subunit SecE
VFHRLRIYFDESFSELRKVAWPTRRTVVNLTLIVIGVSFAVGLYIAVIDFFVNELIQQVLT